MTSAALAQSDDREVPPDSHRGPAPKRIVVSYGFWIFLLSDIVMFSVFFAAYAVLSDQTAGGPTGKELFHLRNVAVETACLLLSSFTCGMFGVAARAKQQTIVYTMAALTFVLGAAFLILELREFASMLAAGANPQRSAFLSAFFALVGCHGVHVTLGLAWLVVMLAQLSTRGFTPATLRRTACFALFWHALDIIWIGVFTIVYLAGARP